MTTTNTGHQLTVNKVAFSLETDCFVNIQKRREDIKYKTASSSEVVNLAYTQTAQTSSSLNLSVTDRSTSLPENRINTQLVDQLIAGIGGFTIETDQFLVTDVLTDALSTQVTLPLFYVHVLSHELLSGESISDLKILDINFNEVTVSEQKIEGVNVYNNLANAYDQDTEIAEIYYVSYLVRKTDATLDRYTEILNNQKVFREAGVEDLDGFGQVLPGLKAYLIQQDGGANFSIVLPSLGTYGIRRLAQSRLRLLEPDETSVNSPWFTSVKKGQFIASVKVAEPNERSPFKYYIGEFLNQNFAPYFPYKFKGNETSFRISKRVIKTLRSDVIISEEEGLHIDVIVYKEDGSIKFALSSNSAKLGTLATGSTFFSNTKIGDAKVSGVNINDASTPIAGSSIDKLEGFVVLPTGYEVSSTDIVKSSYYYVEDKYQLSFFDLNPLSNLDITKERLVVFVKPEELGLTLTKTIFWLLVNEDGQVIDSDDDFNDLIGDGGSTSAQDMITAGRLWFDRPSAENLIATRSPTWAPDNSIDFVKNLTVEGDANGYGYLILGEVNVREAVRSDSAVVNDVRIRGGGVSQEDEAAALAIQPEARWYWDLKFWDGYPFPGAASYFVDVPVEILEDCGGRFSGKQIQEIAQRHTAAGIYPVVHKYNVYEPIITDMEYTIDGIVIHWSQGPEDAAYEVYCSSVKEGPFSSISEVLPNNPAGNQATLSIAAGVIKYIVVVGRQGVDGPVCFSGPVALADPISIPSFSGISSLPSNLAAHNFAVVI